MNWVSILFTLLVGVIHTCQGSKSVQICHTNSALHTDMCVAMRSIKSQLRGRDLLMTFSIKFHQGRGWAAFGVGNLMDRAQMFVLWPGEHEDAIISLRSTLEHKPPMPLKYQEQIHVHSTEIDERGFNILRATCYACNSFGLGGLNVTSENQPWVFAASDTQQTGTNNAHLSLQMHTDYGTMLVDMAQALSDEEQENYPEVTAARSSIFAKKLPRTNNPSVNIWALHGAVLAFSVNWYFFGIILIRSGLKWAFRAHWIVQAISAIGLLTGCAIGISQSASIFHITTFASTHKLIGLAITVAVPVQLALGYKHHTNYVRYGRRTRPSFFHVYLGRGLFIALNVNIFLGLLYAKTSTILRWIWAAVFLAEIMALSSSIFMKRTESGQGYESVGSEEIDPFTIGDYDDES